MPCTVKPAESIRLTFTAHDLSYSSLKFCKWHTPLEPLISKHLQIVNETGEEAAYIGAMTKQVMPPPAESYLQINPGNSLSAEVDISKGYEKIQPGKYTVVYIGQNKRGVAVTDRISFVDSD